MSNTVRHGLPFLEAGQAQKELTHNEAILAIDRLLHPVVLSRQLSTPPLDADNGLAWIVGPSPSDEWVGSAGKIAIRDGSGWAFISPTFGMIIWISDEGAATVWNDGWSLGWPVRSLDVSAAPSIALPTGGTVVDAELRGRFSDLLNALSGIGLLTEP